MQGSRRYTDPERFLISRSEWPAARPRILRELELPASAEPRVNDVLARTARYREALSRDLQAGDTDVAVGDLGNLTVKRLRAQPREPDVDELARQIANQLPVIDLPDLLIEVDRWTRFTRHLTHAGGATPRRDDHARLLFAALIAQACNLGAGRMARASDLSAAQVGWTSEWYLRHDTLESATGAIVDHQSTIALARRMGTGEHSSSDGKRRPVSPDSQQARALPRYALFDLLGLQFAPRLAGLPTRDSDTSGPRTTTRPAGCCATASSSTSLMSSGTSCCASRGRCMTGP